jgi:hypothetical protein
MYCDVANEAFTELHFPVGRTVAERLGYSAALLDAIPPAAVAPTASSTFRPTSGRSSPNAAGLVIEFVRDNPAYVFSSERAQRTSQKYLDVAQVRLARAGTGDGRRPQVRLGDRALGDRGRG